MAKKAISKAAEAAKKKAMAGRGKFDVGANSDYGKPYHHLSLVACKPYVKASADSVAIWGDTLVGCVPPAFAVRYAELKDELNVAMVGEKHQEAATVAASLVKALAVMDATARAAGHAPPAVDGHLCEWGDKVYCLVASGDVGAIRREHPSWVVYHVSDVCALLSARSDSLQAVANAFPNARITRVGPIVEDEIDL